MLKELFMLKPFFEDPAKTYSAREVARITGISHITVGKRLNQYSFIKRSDYGPYLGFKAVKNDEFIHLRQMYNLQKLRESGIIEKISDFYDVPTIVLFGSYATATNNADSDVDLAIISTHKREMDTKEIDGLLNRKVHLLVYTQKDVTKMKKENPELLNSICNGIVLQGELEVFI